MEIIDQLRTESAEFVWSDYIRVVQLPGRGNSVICTQAIPANRLIIRIPPDLLINVKTAVHHTNSAGSEWTSQEILAHELLERKKRHESLWIESLPANFDGMPLTWAGSDRENSPNQKRADEQLAEIDAFAQKLESRFSLDECRWAWQAVNTRCLYWEQGGMTLAPAVDYLNHTSNTSEALQVESNFRGISVTTKRAYSEGEELTFCYGPHDNAFLLVEYGFVTEPNPWDFVDISRYIEPMVETCRDFLKEHNYWLEYTVNQEGEPSFRTEVALAAAQTSNISVLKSIIGGYDDGSRFQAGSQQILQTIAKRMIADLHKIEPQHESLSVYLNAQIAILKIIAS